MIKTIFLCLLILSVPVFSQTVDNIKIFTENYPPYNYQGMEKLEGIAVDLLEEMLISLKSSLTRKDIQIINWARGYSNLQNNANTLLFSTTRTDERENLFKWVGPITSIKIALISRKNRKLEIESIEDIANYTIGVVRSDVGEQLLQSAGITENIIKFSKIDNNNIKMLEVGRIDLWAYEENVIKWILVQNNLDPNDYESVYVLEEAELYYAFNINTSDALISEMQRTLNELEEKRLEIIARYIK